MSLIENKKARFNYEITEKYEAGIELFGFEVKAIKNKHGNIDSAFIIIRGGEAYLIGAFIPPYQPNNTPEGYDPYQNRRLLLTKKELIELGDIEKNKGLTLIPLSMYNKGRKIKLTIAVGKGKKKFDKRETIKKRDVDRDIRRSLTK